MDPSNKHDSDSAVSGSSGRPAAAATAAATASAAATNSALKTSDATNTAAARKRSDSSHTGATAGTACSTAAARGNAPAAASSSTAARTSGNPAKEPVRKSPGPRHSKRSEGGLLSRIFHLPRKKSRKHHHSLFKHQGPDNRKELAALIHDAVERRIIDKNTENMITGVFDVGSLRVSNVMIPRSDIITINLGSSLEDAVKIISSTGHSRYPVITEDKDHVVGILLAKELLPCCLGVKEYTSLSDFLRKPMIVPETKHVNAMLKEFQSERFHMAVVVDEFGGVCGLITIEDILELIVGNIQDEFDSDEDNPVMITPGKTENIYTINGLTPLKEFEEYFGTKLPDVNVDTIAGLILHLLGRFPKKDECVNIGRLHFKVTSASPVRVQMLQLSLGPENEESHG